MSDEEAPYVDYYELLMISAQADRAMIEWSVRLMLARYGPKNGQAADPVKYEQVKEAFRTLVDPAKREAYDALRAARSRSAEPSSGAEIAALPERRHDDRPLAPEAVRIELTAAASDVRLQKRLRQGVVSALYDIVVTRPRNPEMGRAEIARTIGVRNDDLEFAFWFLRERELIRTTNQGLYAITAAGVEWVESGGVPHLAEQSGPRPVDTETAGPIPAVAGARRGR